jgi:hypothetical protein
MHKEASSGSFNDFHVFISDSFNKDNLWQWDTGIGISDVGWRSVSGCQLAVAPWFCLWLLTVIG